jgi:hypothetical protein
MIDITQRVEVCKTFIRRFDPAPRLQIFRSKSHTITDFAARRDLTAQSPEMPT